MKWTTLEFWALLSAIRRVGQELEEIDIRIKLVSSTVKTDDKGSALMFGWDNVICPLGLALGPRESPGWRRSSVFVVYPAFLGFSHGGDEGKGEEREKEKGKFLRTSEHSSRDMEATRQVETGTHTEASLQRLSGWVSRSREKQPHPRT